MIAASLDSSPIISHPSSLCQDVFAIFLNFFVFFAYYIIYTFKKATFAPTEFGEHTMTTIFIRTIIIYIILIFAIRIMGKRQVGQLEVSELVTTFLLSELASLSITDDSIPLLFSVIPILTLVAIEVIGAYAITKSNRLKRIFIGHPTLIICKGKLNQKELERNRISVEELFSQLRLKSIVSLDDVEYAILEQNGQLSVITKCNVQPVSPVDIDLEIPEKGIAHALIIDGTINEQNLQIAGKNDAWLKNKVKSYGCRIEDVFIFTIDDIGNEKLIKRDADRDTDRRKDAK